MPAYRVLLFATLRDLAGETEVTLEMPTAPATVAALREALAAAFPALQPYMASAIIAVNHAFTDDDTPINPTDEIAAFPPVSGG